MMLIIYLEWLDWLRDKFNHSDAIYYLIIRNRSTFLDDQHTYFTPEQGFNNNFRPYPYSDGNSIMFN